jgi:hypothetical protein
MLPQSETRTRSIHIASALVALGHPVLRVIAKEQGDYQLAFPPSARADHDKIHACRSYIEALLEDAESEKKTGA